MANDKRRGHGLGLGSVLTLIFVVLKFTGHIDWSWWWVLSPLWIGLSVAVVLIGVFYLAAVVLARLASR